MKHYLVSGGAGFIGSHLVGHLLDRRAKVTVVDNLVSGSRKNVQIFQDNPNYRFIETDIRQPLEINDGIDFVCNLACPASPPHYLTMPVTTLETSSIGTKNMLELAKKHQARFFHTSTSEIYGDPEEHPQAESYAGKVQPYCLRSCYDEGKRYAEALIYAYRYHLGVNTCIIRIFNTYGPRMRSDDGRVVTTFICQALNNEPITIQGDGAQTRSFCFIEDQVKAIDKLIHSDVEGPVNCGNPEEYTILELAHKIIKMTGSNSKIIFTSPAPSDPSRRKPSIDLAKREISWQPKISLDEGLAETIEWFTKRG